MSQFPIVNSGSRCYIKISGENVAHALNFQFAIQKNVQLVHVLGEYGPVANLDLLYQGVQGSLQLFKLIDEDSLKSIVADSASRPNDNFDPPALDKNTIGEFLNYAQSKNTTKGRTGSPLEFSREILNQFNPAYILLSCTFNIDIYFMYQQFAENAYTQIQTSRANPSVEQKITHVAPMRIVDCRFVNRSLNVDFGQLCTQQLQFQGRLMKQTYSGEELTS